MRRADSLQGNLTWEKLVGTVNQLEWSEADDGAAFEKAQESLGLENYNAMQLDGPLFVAHEMGGAAWTHPLPRPWHTEDQKLLCAGDLCGDGRTEYVLGFGWFGPMGGVVCVYDDTMRKIAEVPLDDVYGLQLEDVIGDGGLEILCWQDHHNGTDGWLRYLTIFRLSRSGVLQPIWEGFTYSELSVDNITKQKIRIRQTPGKPAVIETEEVYSRGTHEDTDDGTSYSYLETPYTTTRYLWNPVTQTFETAK